MKSFTYLNHLAGKNYTGTPVSKAYNDAFAKFFDRVMRSVIRRQISQKEAQTLLGMYVQKEFGKEIRDYLFRTSSDNNSY